MSADRWCIICFRSLYCWNFIATQM